MKQNPDELRQKTANATAEIKQDAKAVAQGVHEGLTRNNSTVDLNTASARQLEGLPGIDAAKAESIMAQRPYRDPGELVTKRVLTRQEYRNIASRVTVGK